MIIIEDKTYKPCLHELSEYAGISLFDELCQYMKEEYSAIFCIEYSGDNILLGWNLKFKKAGKTLCTVYPRQGHFHMLLVVGQKEKIETEKLLPSLTAEFRKIYCNTQEGMGQRWLIFDFKEHTEVFDDAMKIVRIRRENRK